MYEGLSEKPKNPNEGLGEYFLNNVYAKVKSKSKIKQILPNQLSPCTYHRNEVWQWQHLDLQAGNIHLQQAQMLLLGN